MALAIGSRDSPSPPQTRKQETDDRGPVHTLQEGITPEMVAFVQNEYATADRERKDAHHHHGLFHHGHQGPKRSDHVEQ